jgi:hypothetical protein
MENNKFYQVFQRGKGVGYFRKKDAAEEYAQQFHSNIEGHPYPVTIKEMCFLDGVWNDSGGEEEPNENLEKRWLDESDTTSECGGV